MPARPLVDVEGAVHIHIHAAPSYSHSRPYDDDVTARQGAEHGLAAVLLYRVDGHPGTPGDQGAGGGIRVFGGIVLNHPVGGVNPEAADFALTMGAKKVWMPTMDAARHAEVFGQVAIRSRRSGVGAPSVASWPATPAPRSTAPSPPCSERTCSS
jgi:Family of unknown function (DUF6282)